MPRNNSLEAAVIRYQTLLEQYKNTHAAAFAVLEMELGREVARMLFDLGIAKPNQLNKKERDELLARIRRHEERRTASAVAVFERELEKLASYASQVEERMLREFSKKRTKVVHVLVVDAQRAAALKTIAATGGSMGQLIGDWSRAKRRKFSGAVNRAWTEGWTSGELTRAIRGTKARNYKDGIAATKARQARAMANTAVQHTSSAARETVWEANDDILVGYRWLSTLDNRTSPVCRSLDKQVFKTGEGPTPPAHINCRSTTVPELSDEFAFLREGAKRASLRGQVDADLTYYGWLEKQPKAFQVDVLGAARADVFRNGGLSPEEFARLNVTKTGRQLTLAELKAREPRLFED